MAKKGGGAPPNFGNAVMAAAGPAGMPPGAPTPEQQAAQFTASQQSPEGQAWAAQAAAAPQYSPAQAQALAAAQPQAQGGQFAQQMAQPASQQSWAQNASGGWQQPSGGKSGAPPPQYGAPAQFTPQGQAMRMAGAMRNPNCP